MSALVASPSRPTIPGPRAAPGLGWRTHLIPLLRDPVVGLRRLNDTYGDIVTLGGPEPRPVLVFSPELNHQLLSAPGLFHSFSVSDPASPVQLPSDTAITRLLAGISGMNGEKHTYHRRLLMPAFHKQRVAGMWDLVVAQCEARLAHWRPGRRFDLVAELKEMSLGFAIRGLIGLDPEQEGARVHTLLEEWTRVGLSIPVIIAPFDKPGLPFRRFLRLSERLEAEFQRVIARKRAEGLDGPDVLTMLLEAHDLDGTALTDVELLGHLTTLFTAGHETTASVLTWTLFLLTQHPRTLAALLDELDGALHGAAPTVAQMNDLPLLDGVIKESMRLLPAGLWFVRTSIAPFTMAGYDLPRGTHVVFSPAVTHRRPDLYPQPDRFIPERWARIDPSPYEYLPFGSGPRRCLGATFAMMELKIALPLILQRYRLAIAPGTRVDRGGAVLSFPRGPLPVTLHRQDRQFHDAGVRGDIHALVSLP
jgi:cytochrome P450